MKRRISIFALLLSAAFAAVGEDSQYYYVAANVPCTITHSGSFGAMEFDTLNSTSGGYYASAHRQDSYTAIAFPKGKTLTAGDEKGYRFLGWYSKKGGWPSAVTDATVVSAGDLVSENSTLTDTDVGNAGKAGQWNIPIVFAKYMKVYTIKTAVSPEGAGTVAGGATVDAGGSVTLTATPNTGWVFSKWSDGNTTNPRTISDIMADATYKAEFARETVNLTLDLKDGVSRIGHKTTSGASYAYVTEDTVLTAEYGSTYYLIAEASGGWSFNGASTKSQTLSNIRTAQTFAPVPTRLPNTVTLDRNGGTGGTDSVQATYGSDMPSITVPTRMGYDFAGYFTTADGGTQYYTKDGTSYQKWNRTESTTLYAHWSGYSYGVGYEFDGGKTGYDAPSTAQVGKPFHVSAPTKVGYAFAGWKVTGVHADYGTARWGISSDVPSKIESGETVCFNGTSGNVYFGDLTTTKGYEVTLNATWTANSYTVTFNGNGGSPSVDSMTVTYDSTYGDLATCSRTGYAFGGWWTAASGGTKVESTTKVAITANQTLYAHWTANSYTVTFDRNGGEDPSVPSTSVTYDSTYGTLATCARTGYTFGGWWTAASGGTKVESTTKVAITAAQTLYAHWTANSYTVTFDRNGGGTPSPTSTSVTYDSTYGTLATCSRTGYAFGGWWTAASGGTKVESTTKVAITANQTLYAHWTANSYTVSFNANGGDGSMANQTFTYDVAQDLRANAFAKTGYGFAGWNTKSNGSGMSYADEQNVKNLASDPNATVTLYAQWQAGTYTVTFNANGGTSLTPSKNVTHGSTYGTLPTPTRKGYDFTGWWTAKEGGTQITETTTVELTAAQTLYAQWEAKKYKVTINLKDGESYTDALGKHSGPDKYDLQEPLVFGETNLNQIAIATKTNNKDYSIFLGYKVGSTPVYNGQGRNLKDALGTYWTADYPTGTYCNDGDLELTADWQNPNPHYTIDVAPSPAEAGTVTGAGIYEEGSNVVLTATVTAPGYSFAYWNRTNDNEVAYGNPLEFPASANAGYLAVFTGNVVKVSFDASEYGGTPSFASKMVTYGQPYGELPTVTYPGLLVDAGWLDDNYSPITSSTPVTTTAKRQTLYAAKPKTRNPVVTFIDPSNANPTTKVEAVNGHVDAPVWKRGGYRFAGWNPALPETVSGDFTTSAQWMSLASVLDCEGTLWFVADENSAWDVDPTDCELGGTSLRADGPLSGGSGRLTTSVEEPGTMTFWWKGGTGTILSVKPGSGEEFFGVFTGSDGMGWTSCTITVDRAASVIFYCSESEFRGRCSLDAFTWTTAVPVETYNVTYKKGTRDGVSGDGRTDEKTNGVDLVLADWLFTRDNYTQEGWSKNADGTTKDYALKGSYTEDVAITLYPYWLEKGKYTVSYLAGTGATGSAAAQTAHEGETVILHGDGHFLRTGYTQDGWATSDLGEKAFDFDDPYDKNVSTNLYPCWTNNRYTVTFNPNGGSVSPASKAVTFDEAYGDLLSPGEQEGYKFAGWALASGDAVTAETIVKTAADHELVAQWKQNMGEVSAALDCNNLMFKATGGWTIEEDHDFAYTAEGGNDLYLKTDSADNGESGLSTTVTAPGQLTFYWRAKGDGWDTTDFSVFVNRDEKPIASQEDSDSGWKKETITVTADAVPATIRFACDQVGAFCAIDYVIWTPDRKEPEYAATDTPVTGFSRTDGKLGFSFIGDGSTYHLLGTNDLVAPMPWPMVFETNKASGTILFDIPVKADEPKMFYRIRALK